MNTQNRRLFLQKLVKLNFAMAASAYLVACGTTESPELKNGKSRKRDVDRNSAETESSSDERGVSREDFNDGNSDQKKSHPQKLRENEDAKGNLPSTTLTGLSVFLDVGHGGTDPGAIAQSGLLKEINFNQIQATILEKLLRESGANVKVGRYSTNVSLGQRAQNASGSKVFVSLHNNSADSGAAQGSETFTGTSRATQNDKKLAISIQRELAKIWESRPLTKQGNKMDRGTKSGRLGVLNSASISVEACCLTESFFVSEMGLTKQDATTLAENAANKIFQGIANYWVQKSQSQGLSLLETPIPDFPFEENDHLSDH